MSNSFSPEAFTPLSPAAAFLSSFSPRSSYIPPPSDFESSENDVDEATLESLETLNSNISPAAQWLRGFSSPSPLRVEPAEELINGYILGKVLGNGLSQVRLATHSYTGAVVAVKIITRSSLLHASAQDIARIKNEETIWASLSHEYILPLLSVYRTADLTAFFTLLCAEGTLLDLLSKAQRAGSVGLEGDVVRSIFRQVTRGVQYLHSMHIVHGDIKLENIMLDDQGLARIADFGCARYFDDISPGDLLELEGDDSSNGGLLSHHSSLRRPPSTRNRQRQTSDVFPRQTKNTATAIDNIVHGSLPYAAPELLSRSSREGEYVPRPAQDIWALGCVLHALLTGALPFSDAYEPRLHLKIVTGEWETRSPTVEGDRVILRGCLRTDPKERWNIGKLESRVHEVGTAEYTRMHREQALGDANRAKSRSRPRIPYSRVPDDPVSPASRRAAASRERSVERSSSRSRSQSSARGIDIRGGPHAHTRAVFATDEDFTVENLYIDRPHARFESRRALSSESRGASTEVHTPPDGSDLAGFVEFNRGRRRSSSRTRERKYSMASAVTEEGESDIREFATPVSQMQSRGRALYANQFGFERSVRSPGAPSRIVGFGSNEILEESEDVSQKSSMPSEYASVSGPGRVPPPKQ